MSDEQEQEPYVDPNSGLASQPGSYAHNLITDEEVEDPNPDPGGAEAVFPDEPQYEATPVDDDGEPIDDDELEELGEDELEDPNPDPGGTEAELADGSDAVHDAEVETQAADADAGQTEEGQAEEGEGESTGDLDAGNSRVDGTSPDEAPDAQPGADEQVQGPEATDTEVEPAPKPEAPNGNASRADWVEYAKAVTPGLTDEDLSPLTRDQIRDGYGPNA